MESLAKIGVCTQINLYCFLKYKIKLEADKSNYFQSWSVLKLKISQVYLWKKRTQQNRIEQNPDFYQTQPSFDKYVAFVSL